MIDFSVFELFRMQGKILCVIFFLVKQRKDLVIVIWQE